MRQSRLGAGGDAAETAAETTIGADGIVRELTKEEKRSI